MRKKFVKAAVVTAAVLLFMALCACGSGSGTIAQIAHTEYSDLSKAIKAKNVNTVRCTYSGEGGSETYEIGYPEIIEGICNELSVVKAEEAAAADTGKDSYTVIYVCDDGAEIAFVFKGKCFSYGSELYELKGADALWKHISDIRTFGEPAA